jgi:hypothetical protein
LKYSEDALDMDERIDATPEPVKGTFAALLPFLDQEVKDAALARPTATSLRTACNRVLEHVPEIATAPVVGADMDQIIQQFRGRAAQGFSDTTIDQYVQRFRQASNRYMRWLNEGTRPQRKRRRQETELPSPQSLGFPENTVEDDKHSQTRPPAEQLISYSLPLRPDLEVTLSLPHDITKTEVAWLVGWVEALVRK